MRRTCFPTHAAVASAMMLFRISSRSMLRPRRKVVPRSLTGESHPTCFVTIYPSGLCLVMESLRGFGSEISDRVVQNPRTSRDVVLCRLQAVQKGGESIAESSRGYIAAHSVTLQNGPRCAAKEPSGARDRTTWLWIIYFTLNSFPLHGG
jgi:hypothetical protein